MEMVEVDRARCRSPTRRPERSPDSHNGDFTSLDDYVFSNRLGRRLDGSALRRRVERARDAAGLRPLRFHDLRHTYGSLLVAGGVDLASVKAAMGHSRITTSERYLHARSASELADRFSRALAGAEPATPLRREAVVPMQTADAGTLET
jgi:integrase